MEPISHNNTINNTIGWYAGLPVLKPENFHINVWSDISDDNLVLVSCRKRPKLIFNV